MNIKEKINALAPEMIENLGKLVKYDSKKGDELPEMPFGEGTAKVLSEALNMAEGFGLRTKNLDNYCGYAEIGEGKDIIGVVAHLDVVPAGDGWNTDPFVLTEKDGVLYGRGVSDDKGGALASLYALRLLKEEGVKLNKRVRLILGCNEETGCLCMEHYNEVEEPVALGFTPDGSFPGIHGEKGMADMLAKSKNTKIVSMKGGFVTNAVANHCETVVPKALVDAEILRKELGATKLVGFDVKEDGENYVIDATGVSAHASTPNLGVNAIGCTMEALSKAGFKDDFVEFYNSHIGNNADGAGIGLKISDDYGELTFNNGMVYTEDGVITCTIDIRVPVTYDEKKVRELCEKYLEDEKGVITIESFKKPLFFPEDSPLVKSLASAYAEVTGDYDSKPMVIGGGTYAKHIPGIIAFGCEWPDEDNHIHDANERLTVEQLKLQAEIYFEAIKKLLAVN